MGRFGPGGVPADGTHSMSDLLPRLTFLAALALVAPATGTAQAPKAAQAVEELRDLAIKGTDSALLERVRRRPIDARKALLNIMADASGSTTDSAEAVSLGAAHRLAGTVEVAWRDSFLLRQVAWFASLSRAERQQKTTADSLQRAGLAAFKTAGIDTALATLRKSLRRYQAVSDTSGMASVLHNIGVLFFHSR